MVKYCIDEGHCFKCGYPFLELIKLESIGISLCETHFIDLEHEMLQYEELE